MNTVDSAKILEEAVKNFIGSDPLNIDLLDTVVGFVNTSRGDVLNQANAILVAFKDDPDAWSKVDVILERSNSTESKYLALQILENTVITRWRALPAEQREGVKSFVAQHVISISNSATPKDAGNTLLLQKLNVVLVQIVKKDWPQNWPSFVPDLIRTADTDIGVCINIMKIFALLSEDVFDFGSQSLTQAAEAHLKKNFCHQFETVFAFCLRVLNQCPSNELVDAILKTIRRFLSWIPVVTVFETGIIPMLTDKFLPMDSYRLPALQCLEEIASIRAVPESYHNKVKDMFYTSIKALSEFIGSEFDFSEAYAKGSESDQIFIRALAEFLATFLKEHDSLVECPSDVGIYSELHSYAMKMLISLSTVKEVEIFKICLEYWVCLAGTLYQEDPFRNGRMGITGKFYDNKSGPRSRMHSPFLSELRSIIIGRMAKPEEVLVVENDCGEVVREMVKDTDSIILYKTMRETLVFLTHLDQEDTILKMTQRMETQTTGGEFTWGKLNALCWAVGSVSGAMPEEDEKRFLVVVIRELLSLCEAKRGKDNKAVIASNIMYVVGQYPRFLRSHWKFLKTVINKLFEFMHEMHEGVQDMACDTFIKIALKCKRHFTIIQLGEGEAFIEDMLVNLQKNVCDLSFSQMYVFFEAMGIIISSLGNAGQEAEFIARLMEHNNLLWDKAIQVISQDFTILGNIDFVREVTHVLRTNSAVAKSTGAVFFGQLSRNLMDMLSLYRLLSEQMSTGIMENGSGVLNTPLVKQIRAMKKEILIVISTWASKERVEKDLQETVAPQLFDVILFDYKKNVPEAREPKVLSLLAIIVTQLQDGMNIYVPTMLDAVFECTLDMINKDLTVFPEHRTNFFQLFLALVQACFSVMIQLSADQMNHILEAVYWAFQHSMRNVAELGLDTLKTLLQNVGGLTTEGPQGNQVAQNFYSNHLMSILEHVLAVVTDRSQVHVTGLTYYAEVLCILFRALAEQVTVPLNAANAGQSNDSYVKEFISSILQRHYSQNLNNEQISLFVYGFFSLFDSVKAMKEHLRDFLVQLKECASADTTDLFLEEREAEIRAVVEKKRQVPGLVSNGMADEDELTSMA